MMGARLGRDGEHALSSDEASENTRASNRCTRKRHPLLASRRSFVHLLTLCLAWFSICFSFYGLSFSAEQLARDIFVTGGAASGGPATVLSGTAAGGGCCGTVSMFFEPILPKIWIFTGAIFLLRHLTTRILAQQALINREDWSPKGP